MDFQDLGIKEVNAYYARRGGIRTTAVNGYANAGSFPALMQRTAAQVAQAGKEAQTHSAAQAGKEAQTHAAAQAGKEAQTHAAAQAGKEAQTHAAAQAGKTLRTEEAETNQSSKNNASTQAVSGNGNICCDKCQAVSQVVLRMMSKNLYAQSALGYPLAGAGSWTAYQNMANILGDSLF